LVVTSLASRLARPFEGGQELVGVGHVEERDLVRVPPRHAVSRLRRFLRMKRPKIMYRPMHTNGMPHRTNQRLLPFVPTIAATSQTIANPPHIRLNGMRKPSFPVNRTLGSGRPDHSRRSCGRT
jgi:hypothetical protein